MGYRRDVYRVLGGENLKERENLGDRGVGRGMILR